MALKFSVLASIYSKENPQYLKECIQSLSVQTLSPNEIVIVKDGPLPEELDLVLSENLPLLKIPIKIVTLESNNGLGIALQEGLNACTYEYIARVDTDDLSYPSRFEKQVRALKNNPKIDIIGSWILEFNQNAGDLKAIRKVPEFSEEIYLFARKRNPMNHMTTMFKKSKVLDSGGYLPFPFLEDYYLWFRMMLKQCEFYNLQEPLILARIGNNMHKRRKGWRYFLSERKLYALMRISKFISLPEYYFVLIVRLIVRISPLVIVKLMYKSFLRE